MSVTSKIIAKKNTSVPKLIVICGSTATGKSNLAIAMAERMNSVIVSADSRQVYREFNIGTAKPTIAEQQAIPHYLIDLCNPTETLTLAEYQQQAQALIQHLHNQHPHDWTSEPPTREISPQADDSVLYPLLVGGTGLYIRSIVKGLIIPRVPPQEKLRSQLQALGQTQCYAMLQQVDPSSAAKIHANDQIRTLRSLEVFYATGLPMSKQQGEKPPTYPILQIGLECQTLEALRSRIAHRTAQMIEMGFVAEVSNLCEQYGTELPLLNTLGYAEFKQYIAGTLSLSETEQLTVLHTRQFAKRQGTWFRAVPEIEWFDADAPTLNDQVWQRIQTFIES
jgi:tRNA dimethylallyltransferase